MMRRNLFILIEPNKQTFSYETFVINDLITRVIIINNLKSHGLWVDIFHLHVECGNVFCCRLIRVDYSLTGIIANGVKSTKFKRQLNTIWTAWQNTNKTFLQPSVIFLPFFLSTRVVINLLFFNVPRRYIYG